MSYMTNALAACERLQDGLDASWQSEAADGADQMTPLESVLNSPANRREIVNMLSPGNGKKREVEVTYTPRLLTSVVQEIANPICSATAKSGEFTKTYEMPDVAVGYAENIEADDFTNWCGDNGGRFTQRVNAIATVIEQYVAEQHAEEFALLAGTWGNGIFPTGTAVGNVNNSNEYVWSTRYTDGRPNPEAMGNLSVARMKAGLNNVVGFGGTNAWTYFNALNIGCCSQDGMDLMAAMNQFGLGYAYDYELEKAMGVNGLNKFMLYRLGSVQPLYYVKNPWMNGMPPIIPGGDFIHTSIFSPRFGMPMDLTIRNTCEGGITVGAAVTTKLITVPSDQFQTGDLYFGKTGVAKVLISNP